MLLVLQKELADGEHQEERGEYNGKGGRGRTDDAHPVGIAGIQQGGVAHVGGRVDADGSGRHLADSYDVCEFLCREPPVAGDHFALYHGEHGIAASKAEQTYLEEGIEELQ